MLDLPTTALKQNQQSREVPFQLRFKNGLVNFCKKAPSVVTSKPSKAHTLSSAGCAKTCNIAHTPSSVACSCSWRRASRRGCPCRGVERRGSGGAVAGAAGGCIKEPERLSLAVLRSVVERRLRAGELVNLSVAAGEGARSFAFSGVSTEICDQGMSMILWHKIPCRLWPGRPAARHD